MPLARYSDKLDDVDRACLCMYRDTKAILIPKCTNPQTYTQKSPININQCISIHTQASPINTRKDSECVNKSLCIHNRAPSIPAQTLHMSMHLYMYIKETNQHWKRPTVWSLWAQPRAFGVSFLHGQISIDNLVLEVSFTTFRWKDTKEIEIGDWD